MECGDKEILAVPDCSNIFLGEDEFSVNHKKQTEKIGLKDYSTYFNSGVLCFNIENIRTMRYCEGLKELLFRGDYFFDQDILNIIFQDTVWLLHAKYNCSPSIFATERKLNFLRDSGNNSYAEIMEAINSPFIIHYYGVVKPWKDVGLMMADKFWKYAVKTPFAKEIARDCQIYRRNEKKVKGLSGKLIERLKLNSVAIKIKYCIYSYLNQWLGLYENKVLKYSLLMAVYR